MGARWLLLLLGLAHALPLGARDLVLPDLMRMLGRVESAQARFTETKHLAVLDSPLVKAAFAAFPEAELAAYNLDEQRSA